MAALALRLMMPRIHFLVALFFVQLWSMALSLNQEGGDLLQAKLGLNDPHNSLSDWNPSDSTPCNWTGITCSISQVTIIDLSGLDLAGPFPAALCRLPKLSFLSLSLNYINSTLQDASLLPCSALTHLDLSENLLIGSLPASLSSLPLLHYLDLSGNNFTGAIPPSFALFPSLQILSLTSNLLNESIPPFLGNISSLKQLNLSYNPFLPGFIPSSLANLTDLQTLWLAGCSLIGQIPSSLGSLSALINLDLSNNFLTGAIPKSLSGLSSVVQIEIYNNSLSGNFPSGLSNLTALRRIDAAMNRLSGNIPDDLFSIPLLDSLHLYQNQLSGSLPPSAGKASKLSELRIFSNLLSGSLPADLGANSPLTFLDLSDNKLTGQIPKGICQSGALKEILLINNHLSGSLPEGLGQCRSLTRVRLSSNRLSGNLPAGMWGLPYLWILELTGNSLSGSIAPSIAQAANLSNLLLAGNQLSGSIPEGIGLLSKLYQLSASDNRLSGPLPASLGQLPELGQLDLRNNSLSGKLLTGIQSWKKLTQLNLADNAFSGGIPPELGTLPVLTYLDLSGNELNGEIPIQLQNLKLNQFNLSYNQLSGPIPPMFQNEAYQSSFVGNPGLCGDFSGLCSPSSGGSKHAHGKVFWVAVTVVLFAGLAFIVGISLFCWKHKNIKRRKQKVDKTKWTLTSFHKLGFSEYEILKSLDEDNVIGSGSSGKVYKVVLGTGEAVAVKKLWETKSLKSNGFDQQEAAYDAFESEVSTLGKIRHKNIVKLWCCCSHRDCKLLVYEFMPNGSLGDLLHSSKARLLDWPTRLKIAMEAAEGLCYLHHDCVPPIVHRDVKSNNILLDAEFGVKVSDFGVAKAVDAIGKGFESMSVIAGSCGYIAPEYAYTLRVNEKSDIYSFGVVLLELITGKRSVGPELGEKDLVNWVCGAIQQKGEEQVYDSKLESFHREEIARVLRIALLCTSNLPINRPSMRRVVKMLLEVSADTKADLLSKDAFLSPYYYGDDERNVA